MELFKLLNLLIDEGFHVCALASRAFVSAMGYYGLWPNDECGIHW